MKYKVQLRDPFGQPLAEAEFSVTADEAAILPTQNAVFPVDEGRGHPNANYYCVIARK